MHVNVAVEDAVQRLGELAVELECGHALRERREGQVTGVQHARQCQPAGFGGTRGRVAEQAAEQRMPPPVLGAGLVLGCGPSAAPAEPPQCAEPQRREQRVDAQDGEGGPVNRWETAAREPEQLDDRLTVGGEAEGANATSSLARPAPEAILAGYQMFMRQLWRRWRADGERLHIREFQQELSCIHDFQVDSTFVREPDEVVPFGIVTIRRDGGISTFAPELASTSSSDYADFVVGNVMTDSPEEVRTGGAFRRLAEDVTRGRLACQQSCPYYVMCGAGFQSNRVAEHGSLAATETRTCRLHRQALLDVVVEELTRDSMVSRQAGPDPL
jgi:hypothetical protein